MGFTRCDEVVIEDAGIKLSTKIPRTRGDVDGSNPMGKEQSKNPTATRNKKIKTANNQKARKPEAGWSSGPDTKTGGSPDGESPSKTKKDKGPAKLNSVPKAKLYRQPIGRNKT